MTLCVCAHVVHACSSLATNGALKHPGGSMNGACVFVQCPLVWKPGAAGLAGKGLGGVVAPFMCRAGALALESFWAQAALERPLQRVSVPVGV